MKKYYDNYTYVCVMDKNTGSPYAILEFEDLPHDAIEFLRALDTASNVKIVVIETDVPDKKLITKIAKAALERAKTKEN